MTDYDELDELHPAAQRKNRWKMDKACFYPEEELVGRNDFWRQPFEVLNTSVVGLISQRKVDFMRFPIPSFGDNERLTANDTDTWSIKPKNSTKLEEHA